MYLIRFPVYILRFIFNVPHRVAHSPPNLHTHDSLPLFPYAPFKDFTIGFEYRTPSVGGFSRGDYHYTRFALLGGACRFDPIEISNSMDLSPL
jgi:hypothetical protein